MTITDAVDFWKHVDVSGSCWIWTGLYDREWGRYWDSVEKRLIAAHRIAWELASGAIPPHMFLRNNCGQSGCVRPEHHYLSQTVTRRKTLEDRTLCSIDDCEKKAFSRGMCRTHYQQQWRQGNVGAATAATSAVNRFWARVEKHESQDGCWEWTGHKNQRGYGHILDRGINKSVHRLSWELHFGPIPDGLFVCHHCDNPPCVRPDHLFLGTNSDNMRDKAAKDRAAKLRGESNPNTRLSENDVRKIRELAGSETMQSIGARFGVTKYTVWHVIHRKTWEHVQ